MHLYCSDPVRICSSTEEYANVGGVDNKLLCLDLLAIHMVRNANHSTIISFHHDVEGSISAEDLFTRLKLVGRSVYWLVLSTSRKWEYLLNEEDNLGKTLSETQWILHSSSWLFCGALCTHGTKL